MIKHPRKNRALRVLHCPMLVGCNAPNLARGERSLGVESKAYALQVGAGFDSTYTVDVKVLSRSTDSILKREWGRWVLLWKACTWADVVHFNFGTGIFPWEWSHFTVRKGLLVWLFGWYVKMLGTLDMRLLKLYGKKMFVTYQGDDIRQGAYCLEHFAINFAKEVDASYYTEESDAAKRRCLAVFDRYTNGIYTLNPDLLHVLPTRAQFLPYATVDLNEWQYVSPRQEGPIRVGHAPTHRAVKGTKYVVAAVEQLQREGMEIEFVLIENVERAKAKEEYATIDILVDQLLAGWYGGLSVEFMALGRPTIAYLREVDLKDLVPGMAEEMAVISATPDKLVDVLRHWVSSGRDNLREAGIRSRQFVEKYHDLKVVAHRLTKDYLTALEARN